jgi:TolB-like protein
MGIFYKFKYFVLALFLFFFIGCLGGKNIKMKTFVRENVDVSFIKKVAVLNFENHSKNESAGEILRDITITEILSMKIFDVIGKSMVDAVVDEESGGDEAPVFDKETLKRISRKLKTEGLILGSVDSFEEKRDGGYNYPVVTLTLRLIDGKNGSVLWQTSGTQSGYSISERLFGVKSKDINELSFELVEKLLSSLK